MTDSELKTTITAYQHIRDKFTHDQIAALSTMLYRLDQNLATKEILTREKVKLDSYEKRTAWKSETHGIKPSVPPNANIVTTHPKGSKIKLMSGIGKTVIDPSTEELA